MNSLTLKRHNFFQNKNKAKTTYSFAPRPLIFKLQQELFKFRKSRFRVRQFFSIVIFK